MTAFRQLVCVGLLLGWPALLYSQSPPVPALPTAREAASVPPLPPLKSPVETFRQLLSMTPAEREGHLANRPAEIKKRILAKVQEYEALNPDERELRLRLTQVRWYLLSLMEVPPRNRSNQLALIPEADRQLVSDRLQQWDRIPAEEQKEVLRYEKTIEQLLSAGRNLEGAAATNNVIAQVSALNRETALQNLESFLRLPADRREQMYGSFQSFFELKEDEKRKTLSTLSDRQRAQVTNTLRTFGVMPKANRAQLLKALNQLSSLNPADRAEFLKNAERWRNMSPAEREAWRSFVNRMPPTPPLPPGFAFPPPPLPPLPSALQVNSSVSTNNVR